MQSNRLKRLLDLLMLLQAGHSAKVQYLADALGCSTRTVFRDLELLRSSGVNVDFDEEHGGYAINPVCDSLAADLTEDEWLAVLLAASISSFSLSPLLANTTVSQAIAKMLQIVPPTTRNRFNRLVRAVVNENAVPSLEQVELDKLRSLIKAIDDRKRVQLKVLDDNHRSQNTVLSPYRTVYRADAWLIQGWSELHQSTVQIPLHRIQEVDLLSESFQVPVAFLQAGHTGGNATKPHARHENESVASKTISPSEE